MEKERDESRPYGSRHNKSAFVHCEIFVQTAHLFCVKIFLSQISQAFEHLPKINKPLTTSHLQQIPHF